MTLRMSEHSHTCLNCNQKLFGNFCANCGQKADTHRITPKHTVTVQDSENSEGQIIPESDILGWHNPLSGGSDMVGRIEDTDMTEE
jgi:hypothetical protein